MDRETDQAGVTAILECHEESNRWGMAENPPKRSPNGGKSANRDRKNELQYLWC